LKVHLVTAYPSLGGPSVSDWLIRNSHPGSHELIDDPTQADLILFAETYCGLDPYFFEVVRHPLVRRYPDKAVLYHISDTPFTLCRTISPSVESGHPNAAARRSFSYIVRVHENTMRSTLACRVSEPRFLFSFIGDPTTHPVRQRLLKLQHPAALLRAGRGVATLTMDDTAKHLFHKHYVEDTQDSLFVLCPRGIGACSMRLFETMELGRVPVLIGDSWLPIAHLPWHEFALFVPEAEVEGIPALLESIQGQAVVMGQRARAVWEQFLSPERVLQTLIATGLELLKTPYGSAERLRDMVPLMHPRHWHNHQVWLRKRFRPFNPH
jgi:hypothetical protein